MSKDNIHNFALKHLCWSLKCSGLQPSAVGCQRFLCIQCFDSLNVVTLLWLFFFYLTGFTKRCKKKKGLWSMRGAPGPIWIHLSLYRVIWPTTILSGCVSSALSSLILYDFDQTNMFKCIFKVWFWLIKFSNYLFYSIMCSITAYLFLHFCFTEALYLSNAICGAVSAVWVAMPCSYISEEDAQRQR